MRQRVVVGCIHAFVECIWAVPHTYGIVSHMHNLYWKTVSEIARAIWDSKTANCMWVKFAHGYNIFVEIHYNVHNASKEYSSVGPKIPLLYKMRKFRIEGLHVMSWFACDVIRADRHRVCHLRSTSVRTLHSTVQCILFCINMGWPLLVMQL